MRLMTSARSALIVCGLLVVETASASTIQLPLIGIRDTALAGNVVATPKQGAEILAKNPAGVVSASSTSVETGLVYFHFGAQYTNPDNDLQSDTLETPMAPTLWAGTGAFAPWHVGVGLYGTTGASFNFPGDPALGVPNRLFSELAVVQLGLVVGREIAPGWKVAVELSPTYASMKAGFPSPLGAVRFDMDGVGVGGTVGLLHEWNADTTLGIAYRGPAIVFMDGDGRVGADKTDVDLNLHLPQSVVFGLAHQVTDRILVSAQARWTNYPEFEDGEFEFAGTPALDQPLIRDARARFRYGVGGETAVTETAVFRIGISREEWMVEESGVSPLLFDVSDILATVGIGLDLAPWRLDLTVGIPFGEDRLVSATEQPAFPGRYQQDGMFGGIGVAYRFGTP